VQKLSRDFYLLLTARVVSVIGDTAALIALIFKVKEYGSWSTAALLAGAGIAMILTSIWVGKLVDKSSLKKILVITSALQGLVCIALVYSNLVSVLLLNLLLGVGQSIVIASTGAWTPTLVEKESLGKAFGQMQVGLSLAGLAGYGIGGVLVGQFGITAALLLDAASFIFLIPIFFFIKTDRIGAPEVDGKGKMKGGYKIVWSNYSLRNIAITLTIFVTALMIFNPLEVYLTTDILGADATGYGIINMVWAGSLAVGSVVITKLMKPSWGYAKPALIVCGLAGIFLAAIGLSPNLYFLAGALALTGVVVAGFNIFIGPLIVSNSIESELGRVNATIGALSAAGSSIGTIIGGLLGNFLPIRAVIVGAGLLAAITLIFTGRGMLAAEINKRAPQDS
jgi:MFS family permease